MKITPNKTRQIYLKVYIINLLSKCENLGLVATTTRGAVTIQGSTDMPKAGKNKKVNKEIVYKLHLKRVKIQTTLVYLNELKLY